MHRTLFPFMRTAIAKLVPLKEAIRCELGEAPFWHVSRSSLLWVDVMAAKLFECRWFPQPVDGIDVDNIVVHELRQHTEHVTTVVSIRETEAEVILGTTEGFGRYNLDTQSFEAHPSNPVHNVSNNGMLQPRMNDGKCDPFGRLWCGSLVRDLRNNELVGGAANLWCLMGWSDKKPPTKVRSNLTCSNGIAWYIEEENEGGPAKSSQNGGRMYYTDSPTFCIESFRFDMQQPSNPQKYMEEKNRISLLRVADEFPPVPDGCVVDSEGFLWSAMFGSGCVRRFNPETGECVAEVRLPEEAGMQCTACCWAGDNLQDLYITTAHEFWNDEEKRAKPLAGRLFAIGSDEIARLCGCNRVKGVAHHEFDVLGQLHC